MSNYTLDDAVEFVKNESPGSNYESIVKMAKHIMKTMVLTGESAEFIWNHKEYWENGY